MLKFIIYASKISITLSNKELNDLITEARHSNKTYKITGILLRIDDMFLQYIEGPEKDIDILYQKIEKDKRHTSIQLLDMGEIQSRNYEDWEMLLKKTTAKEINQILKNDQIDLKNLTPTNFNSNTARLILDSLVA